MLWQNSVNCNKTDFATKQILQQNNRYSWHSPHDNVSYGKISQHDKNLLHKHRLWCLWQISGMLVQYIILQSISSSLFSCQYTIAGQYHAAQYSANQLHWFGQVHIVHYTVCALTVCAVHTVCCVHTWLRIMHLQMLSTSRQGWSLKPGWKGIMMKISWEYYQPIWKNTTHLAKSER